MISSIPQIFQQAIPKELLNQCTNEFDKCSQCLMVSNGFDTKSKCCTYFPFLPNFSMGHLIKSGNTDYISKALAAGGLLLPIGICPPLGYKEKYQETRFGGDASLSCPYLSDGKCSIWSARSGVCTGFQCYSSYGDFGRMFWGRLGQVLFEMETELSLKLTDELGLPLKAHRDYYLEMLSTDPVNQRQYHLEIDPRDLWGPYYSREHQFYEKSYDLAQDMITVDLFKEQESYKWFEVNVSNSRVYNY